MPGEVLAPPPQGMRWGERLGAAAADAAAAGADGRGLTGGRRQRVQISGWCGGWGWGRGWQGAVAAGVRGRVGLAQEGRGWVRRVVGLRWRRGMGMPCSSQMGTWYGWVRLVVGLAVGVRCCRKGVEAAARRESTALLRAGEWRRWRRAEVRLGSQI